MSRDLILILTPVSHVAGLVETLSEHFEVVLRESGDLNLSPRETARVTAIFTNPNQGNLYFGERVLLLFPNLKAICTASTGTIHIDLVATRARNIEVISLRDEKKFLEKVSSTAEHSLALTLASVRNIVAANAAALENQWDYLPHIGRQLSELSAGVVGLGRLGRMYAQFIRPLVKEVFFYDPYVFSSPFATKIRSLDELFQKSDIISLHVHPEGEARGFIDSSALANAKPTLILINTARGELLNEADVVRFLSENPRAKLAVDVLANETDRSRNPLLSYARESNQVLVTPHIGGMTEEAQQAAFSVAAGKLVNFLVKFHESGRRPLSQNANGSENQNGLA